MTTPVIEQTLTGCLYGRNSAALEKSIEDQLTEGFVDAETEGIRITATYDDGKSASWYSKAGIRDGWSAVLDDISHRRWDVLIMWELSRGDRSPDSWAAMIRQCREQGIVIRVIRDEMTYDPRKAGHLKTLLQAGVDSLNESVQLSERVRKGVRGAVRRGTPLGRAPYGYTRTRDGRGKIVDQVPDTNAEIVRRIFADVARGTALAAVARSLNADGITNGAGNPWSAANVRDICRTRAYISERKKPGTDGKGSDDWVKGNWPAIIDDHTFWAVHRILESRHFKNTPTPVQRPGAAKHLLSGIARCEVCNGPIKYDNRRHIYMCKGFGHVSIKAADLDDVVTRTVIALVSKTDNYTRLRRAGEASDRDIQAARDEAARLAAKLEEAKTAWLADRITMDTYAELEGRLKPQIKAATDRAEKGGLHPVVRELVDRRDDVAARWEAMPLAGRRDAIRALMAVVVQPGGVRDDVEGRVSIRPAGEVVAG